MTFLSFSDWLNPARSVATHCKVDEVVDEVPHFSFTLPPSIDLYDTPG